MKKCSRFVTWMFTLLLTFCFATCAFAAESNENNTEEIQIIDISSNMEIISTDSAQVEIERAISVPEGKSLIYSNFADINSGSGTVKITTTKNYTDAYIYMYAYDDINATYIMSVTGPFFFA